MEMTEFKSKFSAVGIVLIRAKSFPKAVEAGSVYVSGALEDYLAAVKALGIPVVFVTPEELIDEYFQYSADGEADEYADEEDDSPSEDDTEMQDLRTLNPELHLFQQHVGEVGRYTFLAPMTPTGLMFEIEQEW